MQKKQNFRWGIKQLLEDIKKPVITDAELFQLVLSLLESRHTHGHDINIRSSSITQEAITRRIYDLSGPVIKIDPDFKKDEYSPTAASPNRVWKNPSSDKGSAEEVACSVDPFCYISHLSAMQIYGLTNRNSKDLMITTSGRLAWKRLIAPIVEQLKDNHELWLSPVHITLPSQLRGRTLNVFSTENIYYPSVTQDNEISRVVPVGRCFLDMLSEPELCGGLSHVIDTYKEHAHVFIKEIISAGEEDTRPILKVRLGCILDEYLGIKDDRIEKWVSFAQRGGSRKMDSKKPFDGSHISKKWMLSLNE